MRHAMYDVRQCLDCLYRGNNTVNRKHTLTEWISKVDPTSICGTRYFGELLSSSVRWEELYTVSASTRPRAFFLHILLTPFFLISFIPPNLPLKKNIAGVLHK
jgi:hypothetical protein